MGAQPEYARILTAALCTQVKVNSGAAEITYKLYFSSTVTLLALGGQYGMRLAAPYTGVLRLAMVQNRLVPIMNYGTDPSLAAFVEQLYDSNAGAWPFACPHYISMVHDTLRE